VFCEFSERKSEEDFWEGGGKLEQKKVHDDRRTGLCGTAELGKNEKTGFDLKKK